MLYVLKYISEYILHKPVATRILVKSSIEVKFIHSFGHFYSARPFKSSTTQRRSRLQHGYCAGVSCRSAQATVGKGLAQGPYMAARVGVEPTTHDPLVESYRLNQGATMSHNKCSDCECYC